jgi:hypothetical protein
VAKQSGPACGVKLPLRLLAAGIMTVSLTGCGTSWQHPTKSAKEIALDERICAVQAEEDAMARSGKQSENYGPRRDPNLGLSRGENPMEMVDRVRTEDYFNKSFDDCMTSKGYYQRLPAK